MASWFVVLRNVICLSYPATTLNLFIYLFFSNEKFTVCLPLDAIIFLAVVYVDGTTISSQTWFDAEMKCFKYWLSRCPTAGQDFQNTPCPAVR